MSRTSAEASKRRGLPWRDELLTIGAREMEPPTREFSELRQDSLAKAGTPMIHLMRGPDVGVLRMML